METLRVYRTPILTLDPDAKAGGGMVEVVKAADAQATIAALQAVIRQMGEQAAVLAKDGMAAKAQVAALQARVRELEQWVQDQSTANLETMRHTDEMQSRALEAEQQLTQRTAEFQRHDGELQQICGQALGYPWFKDDQKSFPGATEKDGVCVGEHVGITIAQELANAYRKRTAELERVRADNKALDEWRADVTVSLQRPGGAFFVDVPQHIKDLVKERDDLRTLILALPKVEGEIEVSSGVYNFILLKRDTVVKFLCGQIETEQTAQAIAALWEHRQGMEG